jgi:hypothetical protein
LSASASISTTASHAVFHHSSFASLHAQVQAQQNGQSQAHDHNQPNSSAYQFDNYRYGTSPYDPNYHDAFEKMYNMNLEPMYDPTGTTVSTGAGYETEEGFYDTRLLYDMGPESVLAEDSGGSHLRRMNGDIEEQHRRGMQDMRRVGESEEKYGFVENDDDKIDVPSFMWN